MLNEPAGIEEGFFAAQLADLADDVEAAGFNCAFVFRGEVAKEEEDAAAYEEFLRAVNDM